MKVRAMAMSALGVVAMGTTAWAARTAIEIDPKLVREAPIDYVYRIDRHGNRIGPNIPINPLMNAVREVPNFVRAFDNTRWDLTTNGTSANLYGPVNPGFRIWNWTATALYNAPNVINDVSLAPGTEGRFASRFRFLNYWNPGGGPPGAPSGTATRLVQIFGLADYQSSEQLGPQAIVTDGFAVVSTNLGPGFWGSHIDLSTANLGFALPYSNAGFLVRVGTQDGTGNFINLPAPGNTQMGNSPFQNATDPGFPGTNPSSSDAFQWEDFTNATGTGNSPDNAWQTLANTSALATPFAELNDNDVTLTTGEIFRFQATVGAAVDLNRPMATGTVSFPGFGGTISALDVTVVPVDASGAALLDGSNNRLFRTITVPVAADGTIRVPMFYYNDALGEPRTTRYVITTKLNGILQKTTDIWDINGGAFNFTWEFVLGDIDNDNSITVFDYDKLSTYFDKSSEDADWNTADGDGIAPADADIDGDGSVTVFDYDILSTNFDQVGDSSPLD